MNNESNDLDKKNIIKRAYLLFDNSISFRWDNLIIAIISFILIYFIAIKLGFIDILFNTNGLVFTKYGVGRSKLFYGKEFFILEIIVILFVIRNVPLKMMSKQLIIFATFLTLAFLTTFLFNINIILHVVTTLCWIIIFIVTQLDEELSVIGSFTLISYIYYVNVTFNFSEYSLHFIGVSTLFIFLIVFIAAIPMYIIRLLQHDPYKKQLIARLFEKQNDYHEFNKIKTSILKFDQSKRTKSLISIAKELFNYNINLNTLSFNLEHKEEIDEFTAEVDRLMEKIRFAIINSADTWFEVNISRITEFYKDVDFKINYNKHKTSLNQRFLNYMTNTYKEIFENLNDIFAGKLFIDNMGHTIYPKSFIEIVKNTNINDVRFRYSLRFVIVLLISFFWDYINKNWMFTTTLLSFFTLTTNLIFNSEVFLIRVYATVMAVVIGIGILFICTLFNVTIIVSILSIISFLLFFIFKDNGYNACLLFLLGFMLWTPYQTIDTAILFIVDTFLSLIIIIVVSNIILPKPSQTNLIKLFNTKLELTEESIKDFFTTGLKEDNLNELRKNNYEIIDTISKINDKYNNVSEEIELFNSLNLLLEDYRGKVISIGLILNKEGMNYNNIKLMNETKLLLDSFKIRFQGKESNIEFETISQNLKESVKNNEEINFIYPILMSIILDYDEINNILIKFKNKNIFEKYNKNLITNIFNRKDLTQKFNYS